MNAANTRKRVLVLALAALAAVAGPLFAQNTIYNLRAGSTTKTMPDGQVITLWGYALQSYDLGDGVIAVDGPVTVPGPRLIVAPGTGLVVNLVNELPAAVSIYIPGQPPPLAAAAIAPAVARNPDGRIRSFVHETSAGEPGLPSGPVSYTWPNMAEGTYLYHSGSHPAVQVQMGLYGALTKDAAAADLVADPPVPAQAYPPDLASGTLYEYDQEVVLLYSEIDPALHLAVAGDPDGDPAPTYGTPAGPQSTLDYNPKYFLLNGQAQELRDAGGSVVPTAAVAAGSTTLLRFLNAGLWDHAPQMLGARVTVLAEDGKLYPYPREHYSLLLAAGKTLDALLVPASGGDFPIFDRRAFRSNLDTAMGTMATGSMFALIRATP